MEAVFFIGFTVMVVTEVAERTWRRAGVRINWAVPLPHGRSSPGA